MPSSKQLDLLFKGFVIVGICTCLGLFYFNRPLRIAYVDSSRLLTDYRGMVHARRTYHARTQEWKQNLDTLRSEVNAAVQAYRTKKAGLSDKQQKEQEAILRIKQQQFVDYSRATQQQDAEVQQQLTGVVLDSVNTFIKHYGEQNGYDLVLLTSDGDNIAYSKEGLDITTPVIKALNQNSAKK